jgi:hypothetical protein
MEIKLAVTKILIWKKGSKEQQNERTSPKTASTDT